MTDILKKGQEERDEDRELEGQGSDGSESLDEWVSQPGDTRVWEDALHILHVRAGDREFDDVKPVRVFPLSGKAGYVSFLNRKDREVVLLARPHDLDPDSRKTLETALEHVYYMARILRVDNITETMGVTLWEVMTDRGYAHFEVTDQRHIRKLPGGRLIIVDVDGSRFEIESVGRLDERSQNLIYSET